MVENVYMVLMCLGCLQYCQGVAGGNGRDFLSEQVQSTNNLGTTKYAKKKEKVFNFKLLNYFIC